MKDLVCPHKGKVLSAVGATIFFALFFKMYNKFLEKRSKAI